MKTNDENVLEKLVKNIENIRELLHDKDHKLWKKSVCELQYQYNELIFWIYMFKKDDVFICYDALLSIYKDNIGDFKTIEVNAYFYAKNENSKFQQFSFISTEDFLKCKTDLGPLDVKVYDETDYNGQFVDD